MLSSELLPQLTACYKEFSNSITPVIWTSGQFATEQLITAYLAIEQVANTKISLSLRQRVFAELSRSGKALEMLQTPISRFTKLCSHNFSDMYLALYRRVRWAMTSHIFGSVSHSAIGHATVWPRHLIFLLCKCWQVATTCDISVVC